MSARHESRWIFAACSSAVMCWGTMSVAAELTVPKKAQQPSGQRDGIWLAQATEAEKLKPSVDALGTDETVIQQQPRTFDDLEAAASGLNDVLAGARDKLDQLREATEIAAIAAQLREELEASSEENNRLSTALTEAEVHQRSLEASQEQAAGEITDLTKALEEARLETNDLDQQLRQNSEKTRLIDAARSTAEERASRAERQLADSREQNASLVQEIGGVKDKLMSARLERDDGKITIEATRQERDDAHQELDKIRLRIAGLLRSVLHADEPAETEASEVAVPAAPQLASEQSVEGVYEIVQPSNIRAEPRPDAERVDFAVTGETVSVVRKAGDDNWFEVTTKRGVTGFIFGNLIRPTT